jgi:hypothetical protein
MALEDDSAALVQIPHLRQRRGLPQGGDGAARPAGDADGDVVEAGASYPPPMRFARARAPGIHLPTCAAS